MEEKSKSEILPFLDDMLNSEDIPKPRRNFLFGEPRIATEKDVSARWGGLKSGEGFRCHLCGHRFRLGDYWRCVYTNDMNDGVPGGNPLVCRDCDGGNEAVRAEWKRMHEEMAKPKWWTFRQRNY